MMAKSTKQNALEVFLSTAIKHSNRESLDDWVRGVMGVQGNPAWCAYFVCACAKTAGVLGKLVADYAYVSGIMQNSKGTLHSSSGYIPQPGDLVSWETDSSESGPEHISIVNWVRGNTFQTLDGNSTDGLSGQVEHDLNSSSIYQFCHLDWESVGGYIDSSTVLSTPTSTSITSKPSSLYAAKYTRDDAMIREVGYIDSKYKRSITKSGIHLSVLNYTSMLSDLARVFGLTDNSVFNDESGANTSKLSGNARTTIDFLLNKGLNAAGACGIAGNIYYESGFNSAAEGDYQQGAPTSFGICQWHDTRGRDMKSFAGLNWKQNLSKQLEYLWYELSFSYKSTLKYIQDVPNTTTGSKQAADYFVRNFERPADVDNESKKRQAKAAAYFSQIKTNGVVTDGSLTDKQKKVINAANTTSSPGADWCAAWVTDVFVNAGIGHWSGNACDMYKMYCVSKDKSKLKPGMIIAVDSWNGNEASRTYGHVGIYVGNNKVKDNIGYIDESTLDSWINHYQSWPVKHPVKWGWLGKADLTK